ncbi:hypothetical protein [Archangium violaceum]|uniref:Uncharacterized protein n=1 Tax=Archangium violaceum Cb vi76 TaxID=1406225 RepID=A0A084SGY8_9BACT|nr:hypothetical protein [Archangium violaceum]KFA87723.1 hypothetical protein Q664_45950 [Archangium violaceum Cb vi76]
MTVETKSLAGAKTVDTQGAEARAKGVKTGMSRKHNGMRASAQGIKAKTRIKAGKVIVNHNGTFVRV